MLVEKIAQASRRHKIEHKEHKFMQSEKRFSGTAVEIARGQTFGEFVFNSKAGKFANPKEPNVRHAHFLEI